MHESACGELNRVFKIYCRQPALQAMQQQLADCKSDDHRQLTRLFEATLLQLEQMMWQQQCPEALLRDYQALFRALERHRADNSEDRRHHFILVVPVADRPQQLRDCMNSVLQLCETFEYGGRDADGRFAKVTLLVADDSIDADCIQQHRHLADEFNARGLRCVYFDQPQQLDLLRTYDCTQRADMSPIVGDADHGRMAHKGASITRNISYLKLQQLAQPYERPLFYFIDSDQLFCVNRNASDMHGVYALNYFYYLDKLFDEYQPRVVTGKVVGDPPVSPAVMASRLLDDVIASVQMFASQAADRPCCFHGRHQAQEGAYHDMGELYGFGRASQAQIYHCLLPDEHTLADSLQGFALGLNGFFDGAHPSRRNAFEYEAVFNSLRPARTVYTGNYVLHPDALSYFIPFAHLRLRMAGPVLGRIVQHEQGDRFVSVNLPMLHVRTQRQTGAAEFRSGVNHDRKNVDIGDEFERQYYGDVMLFSVIELQRQGHWPATDEQHVMQVLANTEHMLAEKYADKQQQVEWRLQRLDELVHDARQWWSVGYEQVLSDIDNFIGNMRGNFGSHADVHRRLRSETLKQQQLQQMCEALLAYALDRDCWQDALDRSEAAS